MNKYTRFKRNHYAEFCLLILYTGTKKHEQGLFDHVISSKYCLHFFVCFVRFINCAHLNCFRRDSFTLVLFCVYYGLPNIYLIHVSFFFYPNLQYLKRNLLTLETMIFFHEPDTGVYDKLLILDVMLEENTFSL